MLLMFVIMSFVASYVILSYFVWKELRGDYLNSQIFAFSFWAVAIVYLGAYMTYIVDRVRDYWFFGGVFVAIPAFYFLTKKYGIKRYELLDSLIKGAFSFILVGILTTYAVTIHDIKYIFLTAVIFILILIHNYIKSNYKKFIWYKSGKIGIAGSISVSVFFLTRLVISVNSTGMLSFSDGYYDTLLSLGFFLISLYNVYKLTKK